MQSIAPVRFVVKERDLKKVVIFLGMTCLDDVNPKNGYGCPVSELVDDVFTIGVDSVVNRLLGYNSFEYRLNGAGLKWVGSIENELVTCTIWGDQVDDYPEFMEWIRRMIPRQTWYVPVGE